MLPHPRLCEKRAAASYSSTSAVGACSGGPREDRSRIGLAELSKHGQNRQPDSKDVSARHRSAVNEPVQRQLEERRARWPA
jgi:hypothetical protein